MEASGTPGLDLSGIKGYSQKLLTGVKMGSLILSEIKTPVP